MNHNITFKSDIRKKLLILGVIPLIIVSIFLLVKIYFTLQDMDKLSHTRILKSVNYKLDNFFTSLVGKAQIVSKFKTQKKMDLNIFLNLNSELDYIIQLNKQGAVVNLYSKQNLKLFKGFDYSNKNIYKQFKKLKKPLFGDVELSEVTGKKGISYIFENDQNIFIFGINMQAIQTYIQYLKDDTSINIILSDSNGNYVINDLHSIDEKNFFLTTLYKSSIKNNTSLEHTEIYDPCLDKEIFVMYIKNQTTGWILTTVDEDKIDITITYIALWTVAFIGFIILIMILTANKFADNILHPLESLITKMENFSFDNNNKKLILDIEYPLFKKIAKSFNIMQNAILEKQKKLQEEMVLNKQKEKILFEQSKMIAMGEMIGNIAHQWRQPLSVISTISSGIKIKHEMDMFDQKEIPKSMDQIVETTEFLSNTINDLRDFFKKDKQKVTFSLDELISSNLKLLDASFKNNNILVDLRVNDIEIVGYKNEMIQAMLNILNNAKDVLVSKNKKIKIIQISTLIKKDDIYINIQDNGGGIDENVINRIFEPYFTTKHKSQGTGIGLYMTREIIVNHMKGNISVENKQFIYQGELYTGAKFTIIVPSKIQ
jgi:signal transduction histidine kinase